MSDVGVLIVTWNSASTIEACLSSFPEDLPVVVVDNASSDDTLQRVRACRPTTKVLEPGRNLGFGAACNLGAEALPSCDLLLLNPDAAIDSEAIAHLRMVLAESPRTGVIGPAIEDAAGTLELSWGSDPTLWSEWQRKQAQGEGRSRPPDTRSVDWVTGGCCLIRRAAWDEVGGFDPNYFLYFEDLDLCRRIRRAGYEIRFESQVTAQHLRGVSADKLGLEVERHYRSSQLYYYQKHASSLEILGLRLYLMLKFISKSWKQAEGRETFRAIARMAFRGSTLQG